MGRKNNNKFLYRFGGFAWQISVTYQFVTFTMYAGQSSPVPTESDVVVPNPSQDSSFSKTLNTNQGCIIMNMGQSSDRANNFDNCW